MQIFLISQTSACKCKCSLVIRGSPAVERADFTSRCSQEEGFDQKKNEKQNKTPFSSEIKSRGSCQVLSVECGCNSIQKSKASAERGSASLART